jgi:hypothetical protein
MEKQEISEAELMRLADAMAQKLPELDCPEHCDCGWRYQYIELSAQLYQEEWEWACFSAVLLQYQAGRKRQNSGYGPPK